MLKQKQKTPSFFNTLKIIIFLTFLSKMAYGQVHLFAENGINEVEIPTGITQRLTKHPGFTPDTPFSSAIDPKRGILWYAASNRFIIGAFSNDTGHLDDIVINVPVQFTVAQMAFDTVHNSPLILYTNGTIARVIDQSCIQTQAILEPNCGGAPTTVGFFENETAQFWMQWQTAAKEIVWLAFNTKSGTITPPYTTDRLKTDPSFELKACHRMVNSCITGLSNSNQIVMLNFTQIIDPATNAYKPQDLYSYSTTSPQITTSTYYSFNQALIPQTMGMTASSESMVPQWISVIFQDPTIPSQYYLGSVSHPNIKPYTVVIETPANSTIYGLIQL